MAYKPPKTLNLCVLQNIMAPGRRVTKGNTGSYCHIIYYPTNAQINLEAKLWTDEIKKNIFQTQFHSQI